MFNITLEIRHLLIDRGNISEAELARRMYAAGFKTAVQNFINKMTAKAKSNTLNTAWIGEHKLSVFKADFVFQLVFRVLVFVPYDPAFFHVFSVLLFALHIKGFEDFYLVRGFMGVATAPQGRPRLSTGPARQGGAWVVKGGSKQGGVRKRP